MGDVLDNVFGIDPPPEAPPPPPPPPLPEVTDTPVDVLSQDDLEQTVRERARKEAARRGRSSLMRDDAVSTPGGSGVSII